MQLLIRLQFEPFLDRDQQARQGVAALEDKTRLEPQNRVSICIIGGDLYLGSSLHGLSPPAIAAQLEAQTFQTQEKGKPSLLNKRNGGVVGLIRAVNNTFRRQHAKQKQMLVEGVQVFGVNALRRIPALQRLSSVVGFPQMLLTYQNTGTWY